VDIEAVACVHNLQYKFSTSQAQHYCHLATYSSNSFKLGGNIHSRKCNTTHFTTVKTTNRL